MTTSCLDTNLVAYYVEENKQFGPSVKKFLDSLKKKKELTSLTFLSVSELLVKPIKDKSQGLVDFYLTLERSLPVRIIYPTTQTILLTAQFRSTYNLETPDALNIATAVSNNCDAFLTNDTALKRVKEIKVVTIRELK